MIDLLVLLGMMRGRGAPISVILQAAPGEKSTQLVLAMGVAALGPIGAFPFKIPRAQLHSIKWMGPPPGANTPGPASAGAPLVSATAPSPAALVMHAIAIIPISSLVMPVVLLLLLLLLSLIP